MPYEALTCTLRPMRDTDWPEVARIYAEGIATGVATFESQVPAYAVWNAAHLARCRLLALHEGVSVGFAALSPVSGRYAYRGVAEVSLYVGQDYRGRGIGTRLMRALIAASEAEGLWMLQSVIFADNTVSLRLNDRCGFRTVGYRERIAQDAQGVWRDTVLMERRSSTVG